MSAHYTCLQGHSWPVEDGSDICPMCGARALAPPVASAFTEELPPPESPSRARLSPGLVVPEKAQQSESLAPAGRSPRGVGLAALVLVLLLAGAGLGWLVNSFFRDRD